MHVLGLSYVMGTLQKKTQNLNKRTQSVCGHNHTHFGWETGQLGGEKKKGGNGFCNVGYNKDPMLI
jgi:hypothetical protein